MSEIIDFIKDNWILVVIAFSAFILLFVAMYFTFMRKNKEVIEKARFDKTVERFEKRHMKKCKHCGEGVPVEDNICMSCGEIPN